MSAYPPGQQKSLADMSQEELHGLWKRLQLFAHRRYGWLARGIGELDLDGVITDAIVDTIQGKRRWPPVDAKGQDKQVRLFTFLCQTIRSKISHIVEQEKKKLSIDSEEAIDALNQKNMYAFQARERADDQTRYNELLNGLRKAVKSDALLARMIELYNIDPDLTTKEMAGILMIKEELLRNAKKRLNRKVKDLRAKWSNDYEQ